MKKLCLTWLLSLATWLSYSQLVNKIIKKEDVQKIETALSSNEMMGRKAFTPGSEKAAAFISNEFKKIGLTTFNGASDYRQTFNIIHPEQASISASFNGSQLDDKSIVAFTTKPVLEITPQSGFEKVYIRPGESFGKKAGDYLKLKDNLIVFVDPVFANSFTRLARRKEYLFKSDKSVVFVLGNYNSENYSIQAKHNITEARATNVVAVLPGKSKKQEFVIFSAHYDHLGIGRPIDDDSIYNGANDDASGVTAVIEIAKYYKAAKNNERSLVFAAFTAEEIGGYGSQYFSQQLAPEKVVAMFNLEMIGTESKWGRNSAYITGFDKSDMGKILQKNLQGSNFTFYPDPYINENLFYRSDNATLARVGVPAHTISTSKMDNEPNYHKVTDEVKTLDLDNMTEIIKAVVISATSIVAGKDTPSKVPIE